MRQSNLTLPMWLFHIVAAEQFPAVDCAQKCARNSIQRYLQRAEADAPNPCNPHKTPEATEPKEAGPVFGVQEVPAKIDAEWNDERVWCIASPRNHSFPYANAIQANNLPSAGGHPTRLSKVNWTLPRACATARPVVFRFVGLPPLNWSFTMSLPESGTIAIRAEKPSVARDIARVLGATNEGESYLHGNGYVVAWACRPLGECTRECPNLR